MARQRPDFQLSTRFLGDCYMQRYTTIQGEMVDSICHKTYGDESGFVEAVLEATPGLSALPEPLPIGTVVNLPEVDSFLKQDVIALWD